MLADPVERLTEATSFLGVSVEPERAEETVRAYSAERMRERERDSRFHEQKKRPDIMFVRTAGSGDWTQAFTDRDEALFAEATGGLLGRLGYDA